MQSLTLINGSATRTLASSDRGFCYGQGVYTTIRAAGGRLQLWERHLARLEAGCQRLGFPISSLAKLLKNDIGVLPKTDLVVKITLTAGNGPRGYATPAEVRPTRIIQIDPFLQATTEPQAVKIRLCKMRLARQPALAGVKHLNRLEQVLARSEWSDPQIKEGVMLDTDDFLVEGTYTNLFWIKHNTLFTPDLSFAGIAGVMRAEVIKFARETGLSIEEGFFHLDQLAEADEVFLTNALVGILPVHAFETHEFVTGASTQTEMLQAKLNEVLSV